MAIVYDADSPDCSGALSRLASMGFCEAAVRDRLGLDDLNGLQLKAFPIYRMDRLGTRDPLALAIDLFVLQGALEAAELDRLFSPQEREALIRAGILEWRDTRIHARASLYPVGQSLVFSDHALPQLDHGGWSGVPQDQVMYVGTDSRWLARATVRRPVLSALDLCCGSGVHALLAAGHAARATAVDINPRAVACTRFNARAQGIRNLEALLGDLYEPVGDRRFDLITANPPFVPAPAQEVGFRDGGASGEDVQRRIVQGLPRHLAPSGMAQIVTELGERDGESLEARLRRWLDGASMDIHVLRLRLHPAQAYAVGHADGDDFPSFLDSVERWYANLKAQGYRAVASVLLAFQWSEAPWFREVSATAPSRDAGGEWEGLIRAERLARDPALPGRLRLGRIVRTGPMALVEAEALGQALPSVIRARRAGLALAVELPLTPLERDLLTAMDAAVSVAHLLEAAAKAGIQEEDVLVALVALVRAGFAVPAP